MSDHTIVITPGGSVVKNLPAKQENASSIPGSGRSPGEGNGNPLQYSCLENPTDGGAWWATVHGVAKSQTGLSDFTFTCNIWTLAYREEHFYFIIQIKSAVVNGL